MSCVPKKSREMLRFTTLARSSVMVKLANTRSTLFAVSSGMRLAGLVWTISSRTPSFWTNAWA